MLPHRSKNQYAEACSYALEHLWKSQLRACSKRRAIQQRHNLKITGHDLQISSTTLVDCWVFFFIGTRLSAAVEVRSPLPKFLQGSMLNIKPLWFGNQATIFKLSADQAQTSVFSHKTETFKLIALSRRQCRHVWTCCRPVRKINTPKAAAMQAST